MTRKNITPFADGTSLTYLGDRTRPTRAQKKRVKREAQRVKLAQRGRLKEKRK